MPNPYLGHLMRISAIENSEQFNPIAVPITLVPFDPVDDQGIGIWDYEFVEMPGGSIELNWLDEFTEPRSATIRADAFSYSDAWISAARGQHDIKVDWEGGARKQPDFPNLDVILYDQENLKITPIDEQGSPRMTFRKSHYGPGSIEFVDIHYKYVFGTLTPALLDTSLYSVITDTLTVNKNSGGTVIYAASAITKIGSQFYLWYAP